MSSNSALAGKATDQQTNGDQKLSRQKGRALAPFLAFLLVGFAIHLLVHQLNFVNLEGFPLGFYLAAQAAPILLATIAFWIASRRRRDAISVASDENHGNDSLSPRSALKDGLSASGEFLSGAVIVGLVGVLFTQGYDGIAYMLGLMCALVAMSLFVVPAFAQTSSRSITQYLKTSYGSPFVTILGATMIGLCLTLLLAAEISVVAMLLTPALAISIQNATFIAAALTLLVCAILSLKRAILPVCTAAASLLIFTVLCLQSGLSSWESFSFPLPQFSFGHALQEIVGLERSMLEKELADAVTMKQHLRPRLHFDAVNFFAIVTCLAFGFAVLPIRALVNGKSHRQASSGPDKAAPQETVAIARSTHATAWCAFFVCLTFITLPAVSAFAKLNLYKTISTSIPISTLPTWAAPLSSRGLMKVCGQANLSASNLASACNDEDGRVRLHDIAFNNDTILSLAPQFANQFPLMVWALGLILGIVALLGGSRLLTLMSSELTASMSHAGHSSADSNTTKENAVVAAVVSIGALAAAVLIAAISKLDTLTLIAWSASLAASTLFPVIVIARLWSRVSAPAVFSAMIVGFSVWAYYSIATTYFAPSFALSWQVISSAPQWQLEELIALMAKCKGIGIGECAQLPALAHDSANWLGIQNTASAVFALPAALLVLGGLTVLIPRRANSASDHK